MIGFRAIVGSGVKGVLSGVNLKGGLFVLVNVSFYSWSHIGFDEDRKLCFWFGYWYAAGWSWIIIALSGIVKIILLNGAIGPHI